MEMQIPQLRQLFEARVGQISSVLAEDPPPELGKIDPTMRGLKGFLFALEGMLRKDELRSLPFTAREELFERVGQAIEAIQTLPEVLNRQQALDVLHVMDSLHRLCLQENLMASGLDASKLGKLAVILERKLGDVLGTIDGVADMGEGRVREIEQAAGQCLAEIQGVYKKEAAVLAGSASRAAESIRSETEVIQTRRAEAMAAIEKLQQELGQKRLQCQGKLDEHLASARDVVAEARGEQQAAAELLARARDQLGQARTAIEAMAEVTRAAETAREGLQARLSEGQDVVGSIRDLLAAGTGAAGEVSAKVAEAEQHLSIIQQTADRCAELSDEARQQQSQAVAAIQATVGMAERAEAETRQKLDEHLQAAAEVLAGIESNGAAAADAAAQVQQQRQAVDEAGQAITETSQAAAESHRQAAEELAQLRALLARGEQAAGQIDVLVQAGSDLQARMARALAEADQSSERIGQLASEASQASAAIGQQKEDMVVAAREAVAAIEHEHRQFEQVVSEQREAARDSVASLRGDQAIGAELLAHTRGDLESLQVEIRQIHEFRASAGEARGDLGAKLDQAGSVVEELGGVLAAADELRAQIEGHLSGSVAAHGQLEHVARDTAAATADLRRRQEEVLASVLSEAEAAQARQEAHEASFAEQFESARSLVADLPALKATAEGLLARTQEQRDAARAAAEATAEVRLATAEATGEVQAKLQEARRAAADLAGLLSAGTDSRSKIDTELAAAARAAGEVGTIRGDLGEFSDQVRQHSEALAEAGAQSQQLIAEIRRNGQDVLDRLAGQNSDLVARGEQLQQELDDLFGQAADGGLFKQFDDLAEQSVPRRAKWLRLLIVSAAGGAVAIATVSSILAIFSGWAAGAVLAAGLVPLALFLHFCTTQYNAERRAEDGHRYRAAVSRSLTAYRKLLAAMQAEGIAETAFVDRMLSALFGETADEGAPARPAPEPEGEPD